MRWWNAAGRMCLFACLFETTRKVLLLASIVVGVTVALLLRRTPASSLTPHATETSRYYWCLPRRTTIVTTHACIVIVLVLLSACSLSIADTIATGQVHSCALTTSGGVRCWGSNTFGQASAVHAHYLLVLVAYWIVIFLLCHLFVAWRWYKHCSKHTISRCADKRGCDCCWIPSHLCTHYISRFEMLGL
jgi:hypothetical protein